MKTWEDVYSEARKNVKFVAVALYAMAWHAEGKLQVLEEKAVGNLLLEMQRC